MLTSDLHHHLQVLSQETASCTQCGLHQYRTKPVFSRGNAEAKVIICGLNPGKNEASSGIPFVGRSGQLLDKALQSLGLDPAKDVYILNAVKCHSLDNRAPTSQEIQACYSFLERHLTLLPAKVIITLGTLATHILTDQTKGIMQLRGQWFQWQDKWITGIPHPSSVLRNGGENSQAYKNFQGDLQAAFRRTQDVDIC